MARVNHTWVRHKGAYSGATLHVGVIYNAALLTVHATAALAGHEGRARNDARARLLVERLIDGPPYFTGRRGRVRGKMFHSPGWVSDLDTFDSTQDKSNHDARAGGDDDRARRHRRRHRFSAQAIEATWTIRRRPGRPPVTADAVFPTTGRDTRIEAVFTDGRRRSLRPGGPAIRLDGIAHFDVGGYRVTLGSPAGATARALRVARQSSVPRPGPSLAIRVPRPEAFSPTVVRARITPA